MTGHARTSPGPRRRLRLAGVLAAAALALALALALGAAAARGDGEPFYVIGNLQELGQVDLGFFGAAGSTVTYDEVVDGSQVPLGALDVPEGGVGAALHVTQWRCDRLTRRFVARATAPDGAIALSAFSVRTPSCENRLTIRVPAHVARGAAIAVGLQDRWGLGDLPVIACAAGAGVPRRCVAARPGALPAPVMRLVPRRDGHVRVAVGYAGLRRVEMVAVGLARPRPRVGGVRMLLTGDSTIQGVDSYLADSLGSAATVVSRSYPGIGLTTPTGSWQTRATGDDRRARPRVVVVSLGAAEGYPIQVGAAGVPCCGATWTAAYAARVRRLAAVYEAFGARVMWLQLPVPRDPAHQVVNQAVNAAVASALRRDPRARILDLRPVISPGDRYSPTLLWGGRRVVVRAQDGIHLSPAGARIAARAALAALNDAGWLDTP